MYYKPKVCILDAVIKVSYKEKPFVFTLHVIIKGHNVSKDDLSIYFKDVIPNCPVYKNLKNPLPLSSGIENELERVKEHSNIK